MFKITNLVLIRDCISEQFLVSYKSFLRQSFIYGLGKSLLSNGSGKTNISLVVLQKNIPCECLVIAKKKNTL